MSAISIVTLAAFAILAGRGALAHSLVAERNSLLAADWITEGIGTLGLLVIIMALQILFHRFQQRLIRDEHRSRVDLQHARELLTTERDPQAAGKSARPRWPKPPGRQNWRRRPKALSWQQ